MKYLLVGALVTVTAISVSNAAQAQTIAPSSATPTKSQSAPLVTQPRSINSIPTSSNRRPLYTTDQLNGLLGTLEANPKTARPQSKNSLESLIQRFSNSDRKPAAIDPIDFFKPPALDGGVKIPLQ